MTMMSENEKMRELNEVEVEGVTGGKKPVTRKKGAAEDRESGRSTHSGHSSGSKDDAGLVANPLPFPQDRRGNTP